MIKIEEFRPHFLIFQDFLRNQTSPPQDEPAYQAHRENFQKFLGRLRHRIEWELPLLSSYSEANGLGSELNELVDETLELLSDSEPSDDLNQNLEELHVFVEAIRRYQEHLPIFTDVQILNELLILAAADEIRGDTEEWEALRRRLPVALNWLSDTESSWRLFDILYPQNSLLLQHANHALAGIKGGLGGLHLALSGEAEPAELRRACEVMVQALKALAECERARFDVENATPERDKNLFLRRANRALSQGSPFPMEAVAELHRYFQDRSRTLESLRLQALCQQWPAEQLEPVDDLLKEFGGMAGRWGQISRETPPVQQELSRLVADLYKWEDSFRSLYAGGMPNDLIDASGFEEVLASKT